MACVFVYVLLDRATVYLQMWPTISAWYPPVGLAVALLVGLGVRILPVFLVAGYLATFINYHQSVTGLPFLLISPFVSVIYGLASMYLRRKLTNKNRIRSIRDVNNILGVTLLASLASATSCTAILVWSGEISSSEYAEAAFSWWIGDAVALSSLTPFLLEFVIPWCRRYLGLAGAQESAPTKKNWPPSRTQILESFGFLPSMAFLSYLAFWQQLCPQRPSLLSVLPAAYLDCHFSPSRH